VGQRCPKQRHNAVPQHLVHRALVAVHRRHHGVQGRVQHGPSLFRVEVTDELCRALEVGKQHRHLLALTFQGGLRTADLLGQIAGRVGLWGDLLRFQGARRRTQRRTAATAELFPRFIRKAARHTGEGQWRSTLGAEAAPDAILGLAMGTLHVSPPLGMQEEL
jgi:hypothetical protein